MVITANTLPYTKTKMETGCSREMYHGGMFISFDLDYISLQTYMSQFIFIYGFG